MNTITIPSPLGPLRLIARGDALAGVYLPDQTLPDQTLPDPTLPDPAPPAGAIAAPTPVLARAAAQLAAYFAGERHAFDLPLTPHGTVFQQRVWQALIRIPFGETWSYGALARAIERPSASRAVGAANGRNPLAIIIPCHRVIGGSGALTGYAGGIVAKRWLLEHERRHAIRT